jgi:hypothetical protein
MDSMQVGVVFYVSGKKMLEANPATMVTASTARSRRAGSVAAITTANAASYSDPAPASPMGTNTTFSWPIVCTCDQASAAAAPRTEPVVICRPSATAVQPPPDPNGGKSGDQNGHRRGAGDRRYRRVQVGGDRRQQDWEGVEQHAVPEGLRYGEGADEPVRAGPATTAIGASRTRQRASHVTSAAATGATALGGADLDQRQGQQSFADLSGETARWLDDRGCAAAADIGAVVDVEVLGLGGKAGRAQAGLG